MAERSNNTKHFLSCFYVVVSMLAVHAGDWVQVPVTAQIQICSGVKQQFGSCLKWRSRAYKPQREGCLVVWKTMEDISIVFKMYFC